MIVCEACGMAVPDTSTFCTSCGAMLPAPAGSDHAGAAEPGSGDREFLIWERKIPLITNPYLVAQCIGIPLLLGIILGSVFRLITGADDMLLMFVVVGAFMALVFLFVTAILHIVTGGGLLTTFCIGPDGVSHRAGRMTAGIDRAATAGAALMGSMGGTGAGLIAISQEYNTLEWNDVRFISVYPSLRSIVFRSPWLISPVVLYCTEENYPRVLAFVRQYAPAAAARNMRI
ncbi:MULTISPECIES: zinc ribbon domain-containing protein [unclassified Methanoregula]|uniref:zinc ribbon domain-containing protein n=1 Tax=unclassified Methanoregula TaxID=2649730 RepID=UPI0009CDF8BE|nr:MULTISPECIES: zinc ribbon domain-containing protein [unclassified Methanoregula]OPX64654.1 MAG: hypothetical protein A4E33_00738 [Methanoregula sp. PtaB.Bin085]OPY36022.1 MAG: hypothetical protein A4E34_00426 [Methanoregula sp. PtaU1.Bin006]